MALTICAWPAFPRPDAGSAVPKAVSQGAHADRHDPVLRREPLHGIACKEPVLVRAPVRPWGDDRLDLARGIAMQGQKGNARFDRGHEAPVSLLRLFGRNAGRHPELVDVREVAGLAQGCMTEASELA